MTSSTFKVPTVAAKLQVNAFQATIQMSLPRSQHSTLPCRRSMSPSVKNCQGQNQSKEGINLIPYAQGSGERVLLLVSRPSGQGASKSSQSTHNPTLYLSGLPNPSCPPNTVPFLQLLHLPCNLLVSHSAKGGILYILPSLTMTGTQGLC